jgi:hypothetical protein
MLQWLYIYVANVSSQCFFCFYRRMLQIFCLDVSKVDWVFHMLQWRQWPAAGLWLLPHVFLVQRVSPSPLPPLPFLPSISSRLFKLGGKPYPTSTQTPVEVVASVGRQRRNARVVAPVHVVCSLRAGNKQARASVRTSGQKHLIIVSCVEPLCPGSRYFVRLL